MAVTYAQFVDYHPEFSELSEADVVAPLLATYDSGTSGMGEFHDLYVYAVTAKHLHENIYGLNLATPGTPESINPYTEKCERLLRLCYRRGQLSGGGLT